MSLNDTRWGSLLCFHRLRTNRSQNKRNMSQSLLHELCGVLNALRYSSSTDIVVVLCWLWNCVTWLHFVHGFCILDNLSQTDKCTPRDTRTSCIACDFKRRTYEWFAWDNLINNIEGKHSRRYVANNSHVFFFANASLRDMDIPRVNWAGFAPL